MLTLLGFVKECPLLKTQPRRKACSQPSLGVIRYLEPARRQGLALGDSLAQAGLHRHTVGISAFMSS